MLAGAISGSREARLRCAPTLCAPVKSSAPRLFVLASGACGGPSGKWRPGAVSDAVRSNPASTSLPSGRLPIAPGGSARHTPCRSCVDYRVEPVLLVAGPWLPVEQP